MPDLATHAILSFSGFRILETITRRRIFSRTNGCLFVLGNIFPDLLDKAVPYASYYLFPGLFPGVLTLDFLHAPISLIVSAYLFCFLFSEAHRKRVFRIICGGIGCHLLMDALQGNICELGYLWFFPFNMKRPMIINLFYDDATTQHVPILFGFLLIVEIMHRWKGFMISRTRSKP